jgi:putative transposase
MLAGIPVHVIQRGNNRQPCFYEDQDREFYLLHLRRYLGKAGCALHAYCLMSNHVHLLLTPNSPVGCGRLMKDVGQLHTQYMNRTYGRTGSLWEGRYRSCLVQAEDYLLACYRYVEMNPVRANLVAYPRDYPWSSYRPNVEETTDVLITPHHEYLRLGATPVERRRAYKELVLQLLDAKQLDEIRTATNGNFALGDKAFCRRVSTALGRRVQRASAGRPPRATPTGQPDLLGVPEKNVVCP